VIETIAVGAAAFTVATLTLFSGFGLGTLLLPVFVLLFPVPVAVMSTAIVHVANNLFKAGLLLGSANGAVVLRFGGPAMVAAFVGAWMLVAVADVPPVGSWRLGGITGTVTPVELVMGVLILGFAVVELRPTLRRLRAPARLLPLGGLLSGFFGGLSGHQGALRAVFLAPLGLSPSEFAATQAAIACLVDAARLVVYGSLLGGAAGADVSWSLVITATTAAFAGTLLGRRLLPAATIDGVRTLSAVLLFIVGVGLVLGVA
jgi:uncharacterized membrane protein YfcA